jgi:hypothetical protein
MGGYQFHNNEEVEIAVCECKSPISTATGFLNSCQDGMNASMCLRIILKNNDTLVK